MLAPAEIREFDPHHKVRTVIGSMKTCLKDLKDDPPMCATAKLDLWDKQWEDQKVKMKRIKTFDMTTLPKRVKLSQHMQAAATHDSNRADASGTTAIMSTVFNAKCAHAFPTKLSEKARG